MSICSTAFDFRYVSLDLLYEQGLVEKVKDYRKNSSRVDFGQVGEFKKKYIKKAFDRFISLGKKNELELFIKEHVWVKDYALFSILLAKNNYSFWNSWSLKERDLCFEKDVKLNSFSDFYYLVFVQFILFNQWNGIKKVSKQLGINLIGDMPFYMDYNSVECWKNRIYFDLNKHYTPNHVGGFPSCFGDNGQYWGMPCYDFNKLKKNEYSLLVNRLGSLSTIYDVVRLDHFLGYNKYYVIDYGRDNGLIGKWKYGPKEEFFSSFFKYYPNAKLIAEDLGWVRPKAIEIRDKFNLPGMNVFIFSVFDPNFRKSNNLNVYTSTHDSDTLYGWYKRLSKEEKKYIKKLINYKSGDVYLSLLKHILNMPSRMTVIMMQDYLKQDNKYRINSPSSIGSPNWEYRIVKLSESTTINTLIVDLLKENNN